MSLVSESAAAAVDALQQWYGADPFAESTGLYHIDDPAFDGALSTLLNFVGSLNLAEDMTHWWGDANAITALTDYIDITNDTTHIAAIDNTFTKAPNGYTISVSTVGWTSAAGGVAGAAAGFLIGSAIGGPLGGIVGAGVGFLAGSTAGAAVAVTTVARTYYTNFLNGYYDDEGWWALAWIGAYDLTKDRKYLDQAVTIFTDMTGGWDTVCNGGLYWAKNHKNSDKKGPYKNAIANELFLAVAAALYLRFRALDPVGPVPFSIQTYVGWAKQEWTWFSASGLIDSENFVNDALDTSCKNNGQPVYSYNHGVILRGLADLAEITGQSSYLDVAESIADALIGNGVVQGISGVDENGILTEWNDLESVQSIDHCQFKGIFVRNLAYFYARRPKAAYRAFLLKNARSAIQHMNSASQFGHRWDYDYDSADFVRQTAGLDLLNATMRVLKVRPSLAYLDLLLVRQKQPAIAHLDPLLLTTP